MLKQSTFFNILKKNKLSVRQYELIYKLSLTKKNLNHHQIQWFKEKQLGLYIATDGTLSEKGIKVIKRIELLFKPIKKLTELESLGDNFSEYIDRYILIFPTGKLPTGKYARGNKKSIQNNFVWFFQEYDYEWNTIIKATELYVNEYKQNDFKMMRTAMYFIKKMIGSSTIVSDLATYCDVVLTGTSNTEEGANEEIIHGNIV